MNGTIDTHLVHMHRAAKRAARVLMANYGKLERRDIQQKARNDFVTFVDRKSQATVLKTLAAAFPDYGYLGEEEGAKKEKSRMWYIDPLDGTVNYIHGFPMFCISIALVEDKKPLYGLVYDPIHRETFQAQKGGGAFLNGKRIRVSPTRQFKNAFLATGFPFRAKRHFAPYQRSFREVFYAASGIRRGGSAAIDLCYTACGRMDGFWEYGLSAWDVAAASLIVEEAGGVVSDFRGRELRLDCGNIAAGNRWVHRSLVGILSKIGGFHAG